MLDPIAITTGDFEGAVWDGVTTRVLEMARSFVGSHCFQQLCKRTHNKDNIVHVVLSQRSHSQQSQRLPDCHLIQGESHSGEVVGEVTGGCHRHLPSAVVFFYSHHC